MVVYFFVGSYLLSIINGLLCLLVDTPDTKINHESYSFFYMA